MECIGPLNGRLEADRKQNGADELNKTMKFTKITLRYVLHVTLRNEVK